MGYSFSSHCNNVRYLHGQLLSFFDFLPVLIRVMMREVRNAADISPTKETGSSGVFLVFGAVTF